MYTLQASTRNIPIIVKWATQCDKTYNGPIIINKAACTASEQCNKHKKLEHSFYKKMMQYGVTKLDWHVVTLQEWHKNRILPYQQICKYIFI